MKTLTQLCPIQLINFSTGDKKDEKLKKMQSYSIFSSINSPIQFHATGSVLTPYLAFTLTLLMQL